ERATKERATKERGTEGARDRKSARDRKEREPFRRALRSAKAFALHRQCYCDALPRLSASSFFTSFTVFPTVMSIRSLPISFVDGCGSPVRPLFTRGGAFGSFARPRPPPPPRCGVSPRSRASRAAFHRSVIWPVGSNTTG